MKNITIEEIRVDGDAGSSLYQAIRDSAILALQEHNNVRLTFNDTDILVKPRDIINIYETEWLTKRHSNE